MTLTMMMIVMLMMTMIMTVLVAMIMRSMKTRKDDGGLIEGGRRQRKEGVKKIIGKTCHLDKEQA